MNNNLQAIILAAGKSTRFNIQSTKLAQTICGQAMILYPTKLLEALAIPTTVVVGYQKEKIKTIITEQHETNIQFAVQEDQKGTGHALMCSQHLWEKENILVLNGDVPLVTPAVITELYAQHTALNAAISFISSCNPDPSSQAYGRVVQKDSSIEIVEAKDFTGDVNEHCCINAGIYIIRKEFLNNYIATLTDNNAHKELYITDLVKIASSNGLPVAKVSAPFDTIRGINTFQELWAVEHIKRSSLITYWMERGVRFSVAQNVHIDLNVTIGAGSYIGCGVHLEGNTSLGMNCRIQEFTSLENSIVENNVNVHPFCIIKNAHIKANAQVGPFVHIHDTVIIEEQAIINNFTEINKNSTKNMQKELSAKNMYTTSKVQSPQQNPFSFIAARVMHNDFNNHEE